MLRASRGGRGLRPRFWRALLSFRAGALVSILVSAWLGTGCGDKEAMLNWGSGGSADVRRCAPASPITGGTGGVGGGGAGGLASTAAGAGGAAGGATAAGSSDAFVLDCGPDGVPIVSAGPPRNRVNYVIVGDGYDATTVNTTFLEHIQTMLDRRFSAVVGQPYRRYRRFVNICALKIVSATNAVGCGPTAFGCNGIEASRRPWCSDAAVDAAIAANVPASFEVDWKGIILNTNERWGSGGVLNAIWSAGAADAANMALHEGGHSFHQLADEYVEDPMECDSEHPEVNSTSDPTTTSGKWDLWLGYDQADATGLQGTYQGSRYCVSNQYRPSRNSMMNNELTDGPDTAFNAVSREKIVMDIWRAVTPIDATTPPAGPVADPSALLRVDVIDPEVIDVDWSIDGVLVAPNGGAAFDLGRAALPSGAHTITATAHDNAGPDLVRYRSGTCADPYYCWGRTNWARSRETATWTVVVP